MEKLSMEELFRLHNVLACDQNRREDLKIAEHIRDMWKREISLNAGLLRKVAKEIKARTEPATGGKF